MSDYSHATDLDASHASSKKQLLSAVGFSFVIPVLVVAWLVYIFTASSKPAVSAVDAERGVAERIQKVGQVSTGDANREMRSGEQVFKAVCFACHLTGAAGSPKFGDAGAWGPRIKNGFDALLASAMKGKGAMPAQGGGDQADIEVARAVVYMANAGGAKFPEPKAPAAAPAK